MTTFVPKSMPTRMIHREYINYDCPWCGEQMTVEIEVGILNYQQSGGKRRTGITSRRTPTQYHECVDARTP